MKKMKKILKNLALLFYAWAERKFTLSINLVQSCDTIATDTIPESCGGINIGFPRLFVIWAFNTSITAVGAAPTPTEVQSFLTAGSAVTSGRFSNGIKLEPERTEVTGADTIDGLTKVLKEVEGISGIMRLFDNDVFQMWAQNNLNHDKVQLGWVGDNGIWHGGVTGYTVPFYVNNFSHPGDGSNAGVPFEFKWNRNPNVYLDMTAANEAYLLLTNLAS